ncbi:MAG: PilT/PilU family type 4a pilus ATPase [Acidobacteria bacterium]|nr:PilT/PilU family type 4a pilus ATPase [Acidobacteriota bacterium]
MDICPTEPNIPLWTMDIQELLRFMVAREASDLHLKAMRPPLLRLDQKLVPAGEKPLAPDQIEKMILSILSPKHKQKLDEQLWVDLGYSLPGVSRFRVSVTFQRGTLAAVFRRIPFKFPSIDEWGLPEVIKDLATLKNGLVLVTGPTGSGKSSTLASLLRLICETRPVHVVTIEDPIEFLITDDMGAISQREIGTDTWSFADALHNVLRQDPDVIAVGEMRNLETMATALTAAETGHLVFSTLHTNSAAQSIDRVMDMFPPKQQAQVRGQLAQVLKAIVSLNLVRRKDGKGLIAAVELLIMTPRISKLIEENDIQEIELEIEKSVSFFKMQTMNQSLMALVLNGVVDAGVAQAASLNPEDFDRDMRKVLFASANGEVAPGEEMADSSADFSKIAELQEIKRLYDEGQERFAQELDQKERTIQDLNEQLHGKEMEVRQIQDSTSDNSDEVEEARKETALVRKELEGRLAKLQARVKELTDNATPEPAPAPTKRGFFSR